MHYNAMKTCLASCLLLLFVSCGNYHIHPFGSVALVDTEIEESINPVWFLTGMAKPPIPLNRPKVHVVHCTGTAFMVEEVLVTALHVVDPEVPSSKVLKITLTDIHGRQSLAKVIRTDKRLDMAALELLGGGVRLYSLRLSEQAPDRGDWVLQIGNPANMTFVETTGIIVGFDSDQGYNIAVLDTFGGNSGGPDINAQGEVIGMCHTLINGSRFTGIGTWEAMRDFLHPGRIR